jgi:hypothetical protein
MKSMQHTPHGRRGRWRQGRTTSNGARRREDWWSCDLDNQRQSPPAIGLSAEMKMYAAAGITTVTIAAVPAAPTPRALAETMLIVGGTNATPWLPSPGGREFSPTRIGSGFYPDVHISVIDYPASAWPISGLNTPTIGQSVAIGTDNLDAAIRAHYAANPDEPVVVAGASQGSLVMDAVQARYANDPSAPPPGAVTFIVFGAPQTGPNGVTRRLSEGTYVPLFDLTVHRPAESQYNTIVVVGEYDGWADFPDRPWNLISVANALFGVQYAHAQSALVGPDDMPHENVTVTTNSKGGTATTYLVPTDPLPLTRPLRDIGAPREWVDRIDAVLKPIVDAGYSRNDRKPTVAEPEPQSGVRRRMKTMGDALPRRRGRWQSPGPAGFIGQCETPDIETRERP